MRSVTPTSASTTRRGWPAWSSRAGRSRSSRDRVPGGPSSLFVARARLAGYRRGLEAAGIAFDERLVIHTSFDREGGALGVDTLLDGPAPFTAIQCANDPLAHRRTSAARGARHRRARQGIRGGLRRRSGRGHHLAEPVDRAAPAARDGPARLRRGCACPRRGGAGSHGIARPSWRCGRRRRRRPAGVSAFRRTSLAGTGGAGHRQQPRHRRRDRRQGRGRGRRRRGPLPALRATARSGRWRVSAKPAPTVTASRPMSATASRPSAWSPRSSIASGGSMGSSTTPGKTQVGPFLDIEPSEWDEVIRTDLTAAFHTMPCRAAIDGRARQRLDRQHRVAPGPDGHHGDRRVQRREGGAHRVDAIARARVRAEGDPHQRRRARA